MRSFRGILAALMLACASSAARAEQLTICGARIDVEFVGPSPALPRQAFLDWIGASAGAVVRYFGRFPVEHYRIRVITSGGGGGVRNGRTWGYGGAHTDVNIGREVSRSELAHDWVMTHEMVHVAFPDTGDDRQWIQEGVATYVEPLARSFVGTNATGDVWRDLVNGFPKGMPAPGEPGLDRSDSWGRTYWGGALFYAQADIRIRRNTMNRLGLIDALRGILAAGGNHEAEWTPAHAFAVGDAAVGPRVLEDLWAEMGPKAMAPDLDRMWKRLGVPTVAGAPFDDAAPEASIRKAISSPPPPPACMPTSHF
jgi:hypothetical protein